MIEMLEGTSDVVGAHAGPVVLYSSADCWRGASVSFANIAHGLTKQGIESVVVVLDAGVATEFEASGLRTVLLRRGYGEARRLRRTLRALRANVVLVHRAHDVRVVACATFGQRVAVISRYDEFRQRPPRDLLIRAAYRYRVRELVFLSDDARRRLLAQAPFMRRMRAVTIHEGVDTTEYCPDRLAGRRFVRRYAITGPFLLAVGALSDEKGYEFLFQSLQTLALAPPQLVVCGDGGDGFRLQNLAADHNLDVTILGPIPRVDMVGAYNACLALVHARDVETFGLTVVEAMACARPVVAVAGGALLEVLGDDDACGLLVAPNSESAMAAAIDRVLGDPELAAAMGRRGRERAAASFSLESMERAYAEVVRRHLHSARGASA